MRTLAHMSTNMTTLKHLKHVEHGPSCMYKQLLTETQQRELEFLNGTTYNHEPSLMTT